MSGISLIFACFVATLISLSVVFAEKYRFCIVDGRGGYRRAAKYCPHLDKPESPVICIPGVDRLDCLRKISKDLADFSVFTSEDLVTAANSKIEVLLTNELRFIASQNPFEYEVVAIVSNESGIKTRHDLRDKRYCHPGYGYETEWTTILANYLEASVVPQTCNPSLTLTENRIKASSEYFKSACKAGPWVNNIQLDAELKRKYPNLCKLCDNPSQCSKDDKYWGRRGPLYCLTDGTGDVAWVRLDDAKAHFGLTGGTPEVNPEGYSFICPDGTSVAVNTSSPCVWVVKPWSVIAAERTKAQQVQELLIKLNDNSQSNWPSTVMRLIESYPIHIDKIEPVEAIESYLDRATGFLNANSFSGCHPPRTIHICTTTVLEQYKCVWLRESAAAYGIEPDLDCIIASNKTQCMQAINGGLADIVMVSPDEVHEAISQYNLQTLFYETVDEDDKYITIAIVKANSGIKTLSDLEGKSACFPVYDGIAWNSAAQALYKENLINCPRVSTMAGFFGPSCVPNLPKNESTTLRKKCGGKIYDGEFGAIRCLVQGTGDVAFVSRNSLVEFLKDTEENKRNQLTLADFKELCPKRSNQGCHLSWAPIGQAMVRKNSTSLWLRDTVDVFMHLDSLFGNIYKSVTRPYTLFGPFSGKSDVLFHDATERLRTVPAARNIDIMPREYEQIFTSEMRCRSSAAIPNSCRLFVLCVSIFYFFKYMF